MYKALLVAGFAFGVWAVLEFKKRHSDYKPITIADLGKGLAALELGTKVPRGLNQPNQPKIF
jgi:hypothetical protein